MKIKRTDSYQMTTLELTGPDMDVQLNLVSRHPKSHRRWVIQSFLRQIQPWLNDFQAKSLEHKSPGLPPTPRHLKRGIFLPEVGEKCGNLGSEIRSKRLELGLTQAETAQRLGISRPHLSEIERGLHRPFRRATLVRMREFLSTPDPANVRNQADKCPPA